MKIGLVSLNQNWENKKKNLENCEQYIFNASQNKIDLIIFPEMTLTGFSMNISKISETEKDSFTIDSFKLLAKKYKVAIIFGIAIRIEKKVENRLYFISEEGDIKENYTKIHPFSFANEDKFYNAGSSLKKLLFKRHTIGFSICYDLRFPELYTSLAKDCDIIVNIANWPAKRKTHWETLLKARAIENQVFIIGVNRTGIDGNSLEYIESSSIFNADGDKLNFELKNEIKIYEIDKSCTYEYKSKFNSINDRKIEFYKRVL